MITPGVTTTADVSWYIRQRFEDLESVQTRHAHVEEDHVDGRGPQELHRLGSVSGLTDDLDALLTLPGVGRKTANLVVVEGFGKPGICVDTHVHRITKRLGLIGPRVSADKAHDILEAMGDPDTFYPFHINLIRHGREVCVARNPRCALCSLQNDCDAYQTQISDRMEPSAM